MTINLNNFLERRPGNLAKAFNVALVLYIIKVPIGIFIRHHELSVGEIIALAVSIVSAGLFVYMAFQCGWHPVLAVVLLAGLLSPYLSILFLILILIQSRIFLQRNGYAVGLTSARISPGGVVPWPDIPFRKHVPWLVTFAAVPWAMFLLLTVINPEYSAKFFTPYAQWFGSTMLLVALVITGLTYPLSIQFHYLRAEPISTATTKVKIGMVISLALLFSLITIGILILGPAAITMQQQMSEAPSNQ